MAQAPTPYTEGASLASGHMNQFSEDPISFLQTLQSQPDSAVSFRLAIIKAIYLSNPEHINEVFKKPKMFIKGGLQSDVARRILGNGLAMSNGDFWARQRRIVADSFRAKAIESYQRVFFRRSQELMQAWHTVASEKPHDVLPDLNNFTMAIVAETLFGSSVSEAEQKQLQKIMIHSLNEIQRRLTSGNILPLWVPGKANADLRKSLDAFRDIVIRVIDEKRQAEEPGQTMIDLLLATKDTETGEWMAPQDIIDEAKTFFTAGTETSAGTLAWALYELARHPEVTDRIREEVAEAQAHTEEATMKTLMGLRYTEAVIKETMRLYPALWISSRQVVEDTEIDGIRLKKKRTVFYSALVQHRDPERWKNPLTFDPNRFLEPLTPEQEVAYFPFVVGPRKCIGERFAMLEMLQFLSMFVMQFDFALPEGFQPELDVMSTLKPKPGVPLFLKPRR